MGIFSDRQVAFVVDARIEVLGSATLTGGRFRLIIQGQQADEAPCRVGKSVTLRGRLKQDDAEKQVEVEIIQGWLGTRFNLRVDGQPHRLHHAH
jgi:hypothetical protein